jgi:hypothetical protein
MTKYIHYILLFLLLSPGLLVAQPSSPKIGAGYDDLRFPATRLATGASNPPANRFWLDDGAGSAGLLALEFEDAIGANEEQVWGIAQMPHAWREATDADFHIHWQLEDTTSCNARFCVEYATGDFDTSWPANTSTICADCASGGSTDQQYCDVGTISMTGLKISALISFRLYRNSGNAADTCVSKDALLHTADIHYQIDRPGGSRQELTK